ncbi:MAG: SPOR domain-containing protein [Bryobacteraceae bacterium]
MPKNEDGEFELILGNRQLLSVFFIVAILLGVFFTMGYIVGRNSTPLVAAEATPVRKPEPKPLVVDSPVPTSSAVPLEEPTPAPRPEPVVAKVATPEKPAPAVVTNQPAAGEVYLQLVATAKAEADVMVDVLRKKGFKARDVEIPEKRGMFRVLVGPLAEGMMNETKTDLQSAGFPGDQAIRKTF